MLPITLDSSFNVEELVDDIFDNLLSQIELPTILHPIKLSKHSDDIDKILTI